MLYLGSVQSLATIKCDRPKEHCSLPNRLAGKLKILQFAHHLLTVTSYQLSVISFILREKHHTPVHRNRWCQYNHTSPRKRHCGWYCFNETLVGWASCPPKLCKLNAQQLVNDYQTLKRQSQTLVRKYQTLKRQSQTLKRQSQILKRQSQILKRQSQILKRQSQILKREYQTLKREYQTLKREYQTLKREYQNLVSHKKEIMASPCQ
ncbi:hypothetical protein [Scytonema sp. PCC 10023]|uniref:hypothetical protein n=1 Tax=Scytonema sp. PCC 10023 TaxID=1680591 RepID=UPI0039C70858